MEGRRRIHNEVLKIPLFAWLFDRCFEVYPDPIMQEVTHFCLPGLMPILKNTVQFVHQVGGVVGEVM